LLGNRRVRRQLTDYRQRRKVMGDAYVDKALAGGVSEFSRPAQEYVTRNAWDGIWGREGLEFKHRSLVVIR
jgi:4-carboxymuconolactone decarboxylase